MSRQPSRRERLCIALAAIASVGSLAALVLPFTSAGLLTGHDATAHLTYTYLFDRAFAQGQFPVRWVEWVGYGESQPLFNFYPPGLYYLIELIHLLGVPLSVALKSAVLLLWWSGALFTFAWLRPLDATAAGLGAVLFALSPYVIVDVFVRASYPEVASMAVAPGLLWAIDRLVRRARLDDALVAASLVAALLLCHLLTSLIFAPVLIAYALVRMSATPHPVRRLWLLAFAATLGAGMAAFFVVPSMVELPSVAIGRMTSGYSDYQQHFVAPSQWWPSGWGYGASVAGPGDGLPFRIDAVQWLAVLLAMVWLGTTRLRHRLSAPRAELTLWLVVVLAAMFLMTGASAVLWRHVPLLAYLQFPWRYFMLVSVGSAALAAMLSAGIPDRTIRALVVIAVIGWQYQTHRLHLTPASYIPRQAMNIDNPRWPEFAARGVEPFIERGFTPVAAPRPAPAGIGRWTLLEGQADITAVREADHRLTIETRSAAGARLRINTHAFPGWQVRVDGVPVAAAIDPDYGYLEVTAPAGAHRIDAALTNTPVRTLANGVSTLSVTVWVIGLAGHAWRSRRHWSATAPRERAASAARL